MSDTLIKRSRAVIMTHLSAAPDPDSSSRPSKTDICLWVSITALIPGGIWHIFQWGAIRTPGEAVSRRTTCGKIPRRVTWSEKRPLVPPLIKGAQLVGHDIR